MRRGRPLFSMEQTAKRIPTVFSHSPFKGMEGGERFGKTGSRSWDTRPWNIPCKHRFALHTCLCLFILTTNIKWSAWRAVHQKMLLSVYSWRHEFVTCITAVVWAYLIMFFLSDNIHEPWIPPINYKITILQEEVYLLFRNGLWDLGFSFLFYIYLHILRFYSIFFPRCIFFSFFACIPHSVTLMVSTTPCLRF